MLISNTITDALIELGVLNPNDEATPQDHEFGLRTLNRIIDSYNTQNLTITYLEDIKILAPYTTNECESADPDDFTVRQWNNTLTIGHCQDVNMAAPVDIEGLFWRQDQTDYKSIEMAYNQWSDIVTKGDSTIPRRHYIQRMDNNNIKLYFDYVPQQDLELHLLAKMPYTGVNSIGNEYLPTDDINWNYGFEKMLMKRLAVELAASYEVPVTQLLLSTAMESEMRVKNHNKTPMTLDSDLSLLQQRRGWLNYTRRN